MICLDAKKKKKMYQRITELLVTRVTHSLAIELWNHDPQVRREFEPPWATCCVLEQDTLL